MDALKLLLLFAQLFFVQTHERLLFQTLCMLQHESPSRPSGLRLCEEPRLFNIHFPYTA